MSQSIRVAMRFALNVAVGGDLRREAKSALLYLWAQGVRAGAWVPRFGDFTNEAANSCYLNGTRSRRQDQGGSDETDEACCRIFLLARDGHIRLCRLDHRPGRAR